MEREIKKKISGCGHWGGGGRIPVRRESQRKIFKKKYCNFSNSSMSSLSDLARFKNIYIYQGGYKIY